MTEMTDRNIRTVSDIKLNVACNKFKKHYKISKKLIEQYQKQS